MKYCVDCKHSRHIGSGLVCAQPDTRAMDGWHRDAISVRKSGPCDEGARLFEPKPADAPPPRDEDSTWIVWLGLGIVVGIAISYMILLVLKA